MRFHPVVDIVHVVGDVVDEVDDLGLDGGLLGGRELVELALGEALVSRVVLDDSFADLVGEIETPKSGIAFFQLVDGAEGMPVVLEAPRVGHQGVECFLADMAEGRMADVVGQGNRLGQCGVQTEGAGHRTCQQGHLDRVRKAGSEMIPFVVREHLRLVLEAAKGARVNDPVPVALVAVAIRVLGLAVAAAAAVFGPGCVGADLQSGGHRSTSPSESNHGLLQAITVLTRPRRGKRPACHGPRDWGIQRRSG